MINFLRFIYKSVQTKFYIRELYKKFPGRE